MLKNYQYSSDKISIPCLKYVHYTCAYLNRPSTTNSCCANFYKDDATDQCLRMYELLTPKK